MVGQRKKVNKNDRTRSLRSFKTIEPNAAVIDLGSREHWVAGPPWDDAGPNVARFGTTTPELVRLADWLAEQGVKTVPYWKPVFNILEDSFEVILANARHIKNVPGRKTDVKDSEWIYKLLRSGLLTASFVPPQKIRDLRDLTRATGRN